MASVALAWMRSASMYWALAVGWPILMSGASKSPQGPDSVSPWVATLWKASQEALWELSRRASP